MSVDLHMCAYPYFSADPVELQEASNQHFEWGRVLNPSLGWRHMEKHNCFLSQPQEEKQDSLEMSSLSAISVVAS